MPKPKFQAEPAKPVVENRMVTDLPRSSAPALVKVRAVRNLLEGELRQPGDVFELATERAKALGALVVII